VSATYGEPRVLATYEEPPELAEYREPRVLASSTCTYGKPRVLTHMGSHMCWPPTYGGATRVNPIWGATWDKCITW
jgi:hypothetical protein